MYIIYKKIVVRGIRLFIVGLSGSLRQGGGWKIPALQMRKTALLLKGGKNEIA